MYSSFILFKFVLVCAIVNSMVWLFFYNVPCASILLAIVLKYILKKVGSHKKSISATEVFHRKSSIS